MNAAPVIYLTEEDGRDEIKDRARMLKAGLAVSEPLHIDYVIKNGLRLGDAGLLQLRQLIDAKKPALVVLDSFRALLPPGVKEDSSDDVAPVVRALAALAGEFNCTILLIHHVSKSAGLVPSLADVRGSGDIVNAARAVILLGRRGTTWMFDLVGNVHGLDQERGSIQLAGDEEARHLASVTAATTTITASPAHLKEIKEAIIKILAAAGGELRGMGVLRSKLKSAVGQLVPELTAAIDDLVAEGRLQVREEPRAGKGGGSPLKVYGLAAPSPEVWPKRSRRSTEKDHDQAGASRPPLPPAHRGAARRPGAG